MAYVEAERSDAFPGPAFLSRIGRFRLEPRPRFLRAREVGTGFSHDEDRMIELGLRFFRYDDADVAGKSIADDVVEGMD